MTRVVLISLLLILNDVASSQTQFWQQTNGPRGGSIRSFADNGYGTVYVATSSSGIFRSGDNGITWQHMGVPYWSFNSVAVTQNGTILAGHSAGLFRSTDEGLQWFEVRPTPYTGKAIVPSPNGHVFASVGGIIHRSTDDGATWERSDTGVNTIVDCLGVDSVGRVYAGGNGVYRSTDDGYSWTLQFSGLNLAGVVSFAVDSSGVVYAANSLRIVRSTDNGEQWEVLNFPAATPLFRSIVTKGAGELFVGTWSYGVFRSSDFGSTWTAFQQGIQRQGGIFALGSNKTTNTVYAGVEIDGIYRWVEGENEWSLVNFPGTTVLSLAGDQMGAVFSSAVLTGVWKTTDRGQQWVQCRQGLADTNIIGLLSLPSGTLLAYGSAPGSIYRSTNGGNSWISANNGVAGIYLRSSAVDSAGTVYLGTNDGIYVSQTDGETWNPVGTIPYMPASIAVTTAGLLFADVPPGAVSRSTDHGATWTLADSGLADFHVQLLSASRNGTLHAGGYSGIFNSTNSGISWRRSLTVADGRVTSFVRNSLGDLFAAFDDGRVFRQRSGDTAWADISAGLPFMIINSMTINSEGFLFAGTYGASVLRTVDPTTNVEESPHGLPARALLLQNYPNPFNPSTTIPFHVPYSSLVTLRIFDVLGREVATLVNEKMTPGRYEHVFDATQVGSGVYFYRLSISSMILTKKMMVVR